MTKPHGNSRAAALLSSNRHFLGAEDAIMTVQTMVEARGRQPFLARLFMRQAPPARSARQDIALCQCAGIAFRLLVWATRHTAER